MKNISTILAIGLLTFFLSAQVSASGYGGQTESAGKASGSMAEAIKYAEMAKTHGDDAKEILQHAEMGLKFTEDAEKEAIEKVNVQGVEHITASISQLVEAINHAKMGHADVAIKHIDENNFFKSMDVEMKVTIEEIFIIGYLSNTGDDAVKQFDGDKEKWYDYNKMEHNT